MWSASGTPNHLLVHCRSRVLGVDRRERGAEFATYCGVSTRSLERTVTGRIDQRPASRAPRTGRLEPLPVTPSVTCASCHPRRCVFMVHRCPRVLLRRRTSFAYFDCPCERRALVRLRAKVATFRPCRTRHQSSSDSRRKAPMRIDGECPRVALHSAILSNSSTRMSPSGDTQQVHRRYPICISRTPIGIPNQANE